jgi:hypothetical protein
MMTRAERQGVAMLAASAALSVIGVILLWPDLGPSPSAAAGVPDRPADGPQRPEAGPLFTVPDALRHVLAGR